ncbi:hypothetical protein N7475_008622 [Penicillium sp. IBT 31633x]|nr:hypothetical protein N7475_008622 [Penicillium sp. IBT 31633x]
MDYFFDSCFGEELLTLRSAERLLSRESLGLEFSLLPLLEGNEEQYLELADSLNWCSIEIYVAICCGSAPSLSVLIKTYAPRFFGSYHGGQRYRSYSHSHGDQALQRIVDRSKPGWLGHHADDPKISTGSQKAIVPDDGIVMKTDMHMEVGPSDPKENHMRRNKYDGGF